MCIEYLVLRDRPALATVCIYNYYAPTAQLFRHLENPDILVNLAAFPFLVWVIDLSKHFVVGELPVLE